MVAPRALVFWPLVKGNEDSGNEIGLNAESLSRGNTLFLANHSLVFHKLKWQKKLSVNLRQGKVRDLCVKLLLNSVNLWASLHAWCMQIVEKSNKIFWRTAVRFPSTSSHMCCVELALKGVLFAPTYIGPDSGRTRSTLCVGVLQTVRTEFFVFERGSWCAMDLPEKSSCYDAVPACLCTSCQLFVLSLSSVSSSFLPPRYAASLYSSPADSCEVSSVLSTRPSCSVADSTCGLASIVPPRRPSRRFEFAVSSPPFMLPVSSAAVSAVSSSSDAVPSGSVLPSPDQCRCCVL